MLLSSFLKNSLANRSKISNYLIPLLLKDWIGLGWEEWGPSSDGDSVPAGVWGPSSDGDSIPAEDFIG